MSLKIADDSETFQAVGKLWQEYWNELGLPAEFQGFASELQYLPGKYASPSGALVLAFVDGLPAATVALRPLSARACEVKRLFVRAEFRRQGIGRQLMQWVLRHARKLGYETVHGDTLPTMQGALRMYRDLGFEVMTEPYSENPTAGAIYLRLSLKSYGRRATRP